MESVHRSSKSLSNVGNRNETHKQVFEYETAAVRTHLQETVSSTLVAGIAAVNGSTSPIHAMFVKLLPPGRSQTARYLVP